VLIVGWVGFFLNLPIICLDRSLKRVYFSLRDGDALAETVPECVTKPKWICRLDLARKGLENNRVVEQ